MERNSAPKVFGFSEINLEVTESVQHGRFGKMSFVKR
jgi:hypothetical protein